MGFYRQYLVIGGMPECVFNFIQTKDYILVRHLQDTILKGYLNDMSKCNKNNEIKKTRLAYDNIAVQLSKTNTRSQYKWLKKGDGWRNSRTRLNGFAFQGIVSRVYYEFYYDLRFLSIKFLNNFIR